MTHQTTLSRGRGAGEILSFDCLLAKTLGRVRFLNRFVHDCSKELSLSQPEQCRGTSESCAASTKYINSGS